MKTGLLGLLTMKSISTFCAIALVCGALAGLIGSADAASAAGNGGTLIGEGGGIAVHDFIPGVIDGFKSTSHSDTKSNSNNVTAKPKGK